MKPAWPASPRPRMRDLMYQQTLFNLSDLSHQIGTAAILAPFLYAASRFLRFVKDDER